MHPNTQSAMKVLFNDTFAERCGMQLQTIMNHVTNYKPFVFGEAHWEKKADRSVLRVQMKARANGQPRCSGCQRRRPGYDRLRERTWDFVPLWQIAVLLVYAPRRVDCPQCGVVVEQLPWSDGKSRQTREYRLFLARWARRLSWQEVANIFHSSWDSVYRAVQYVVSYGLVHRDETGVEAIGVDEIQYQRGHKYLTLVYQIDAGRRRLLWIAQDRTTQALERFFDTLGQQVLPTLKFVCSDMWRPYLDVIAQRAGKAVHVLDRYHIMARMNKAIDKVRAGEARRMKADGYEPVLKHSRWCLMKRPAHLTSKQVVKLRELMQYNLATMRAYLQREEFQRFWMYRSAAWAGKFLDDWITRTLRSRLDPMKTVARSLRAHRELLLNWFRAKGEISAGIVEGFNNKAKLTMRKSYGFRSDRAIETALYHSLGDLPEPKSTHEFC
jgi:transposase